MRKLAIWFLATSIIFAGAFAYADSPGKKQRSLGIAKRAPWTTSRITGSPEPPPPYRIERVFPKLTFENPIALVALPHSKRMVLVEVNGKIYTFDSNPQADGRDLAIDLQKEIEGHKRTYGIAFHPDFEKNRYVYLCYVTKEGDPLGTHVSRFRVEASNPPRIDPKSETTIIQWYAGGHNGGCMKFGPDGYLYITTGDGSSPAPPDKQDTGQSVDDLLSSVLRIDVDHPVKDRAYSIPKDNPFVSLQGARGEIWAYGFRNPWKISFDQATGDLWLGDVGWEMWEMIYRIERGGNYGWSVIEGHQPVRNEATRGPTPILPPTVAHSHIESRSITGGLVYRGKRIKDLAGTYIYGDYVTGIIWGLRYKDGKVVSKRQLVDTPLQVIAFGTDHAGEMYVMGYGGTIHRLVKNDTARVNRDFPTKLSQTGLFASVKGHRTAGGVIPYSINAEPWADGARAERFLAVPGKGKLGVYTAKEHSVQHGNVKGEWKHPSDSVLVKTLSLPTPQGWRRVETQILHRDVDTWRGYTFAWNDQQTDAVLVPAEGQDRTYAVTDPRDPSKTQQQSWHFAARNECIVCHTTRAGTIHGFNVRQINRDLQEGKATSNQLKLFSDLGLFSEPLSEKPAKMPVPHDISADINARARAYLHANCAHCHRRGGGGTAIFEVLYDLPIEKTALLGARPTQGTFGLHRAEVVAPGDPYRSVLLYRMSKLGRGRMPHAGSSVVDTQGLQLIHDWIAQLPAPTDEPAAKRDATEKLRKQQTSALTQLQNGKGNEQLIEQLLSSTSGALRLASRVAQGKLKSSVREKTVALATSHSAAEVRDLFERFVPEEQRTKRLGSVVQPNEILSLKGQVDRGRHLFFNVAGVQCKSCHRIGKEGKEIGPDLSKIGKENGRDKLLESILQPSKNIDPKFVAYLVETVDGRVHSGLLVEKNDKGVVIKDAQNKLIRIAAADIEFFAPQQKSLMPELLLRDMTAQQVADLLEFLSSQKK